MIAPWYCYTPIFSFKLKLNVTCIMQWVKDSVMNPPLPKKTHCVMNFQSWKNKNIFIFLRGEEPAQLETGQWKKFGSKKQKYLYT